MSVADTIQGHILRLHQKLYERSDGMVGHSILGVPALLLRTTGRHSGAQRCSALMYAADGPNYVVVASNGGSDSPPGWLHNVRAKPEVEIQIGRTKKPANARVVESGDAEYARLWKLVNDNNRGRYDAYQQHTARPIPLVVVSPA